jgi:exportin-1
VTFYQLLLAITSHCFPALAALAPMQFKMVVTSVVWAFKHPIRSVAETGLKIVKQLFEKVVLDPAVAQNFFAEHFLDLLQHIFAVVTDSTHLSGTGQKQTPGCVLSN